MRLEVKTGKKFEFHKQGSVWLYGTLRLACGRDEHGFGFTYCQILVFWWIWIGFYNFCLTEFGLDLRISFWTCSQPLVHFWVCRLLHVICYVWLSGFFHVRLYCTVHRVCSNHGSWLWPVIQYCSLMHHVIKVTELIWLSLIQSFSLNHDFHT